MKGLVYKKIADSFCVKCGDEKFVCVPRGNLKEGGIFVGDIVEFDKIGNVFTIEKIYERKNQFVRPPLANLDALVIVIAQVPAPDFMIVDKLILFCKCYGVEPILVVNKLDLDQGLSKKALSAYSHVIQNIIFTNAKTGEGLDKLKQVLKDKLSAFAGQSAVGKSALVNMILKKHASQEGEISIKNLKGKNTTRHSEIFFEDDILITDTAGFTSLDEKLLPISYFELPYYYPDFLEFLEDCKYKSCAHIKEREEDCAVKRAVTEGLVDKGRYSRYIEIYNKLYEKWVRTHG